MRDSCPSDQTRQPSLRLRPRLGDALRDEAGIALIVAMGVMMTMLLLGGAILGAALQLSQSSRTDTNQKQALEAANAGLAAATYRLNMLSPSPTLCVTDIVTLPLSNGACAAVTKDLGNGASYTYITTPALSLTGTCAGLPLDNSAVIQRCVTSTGTVNGVVRRVQTRIGAYAAAPVFPVAGFVGLHSVVLPNNTHVNGTEASNGQITLNNNATVTATILAPGAPNPSLAPGATDGTVTTRTTTQGQFVLSPVDPGTSATINSDTRITNGADAVTGAVVYDAATRSLTLGTGASLTIGGTLPYNFCNLTVGLHATLTLATGVRAAIYIDSPDRTGSPAPCPAGSGNLNVSNGGAIINNSPPAAGSALLHDTTALQLYVYGTSPPGSNVVALANNVAFYGTLYAPQSTVNLTNNGSTNGAVAGYNIAFLNNATFNSDANDLSITTNAAVLFFRTSWHQCLDQPSNASDPQSGC
jgi:Tfp pilus assembly protein PilX